VAEISEVEASLEEAMEKQNKASKNKTTSEAELARLKEEIKEITEKISSIPAEIIDVVKVREDLRKHKHEISALNDKNEEFEKKKHADQEDYVKISAFLNSFDKEVLYNNRLQVSKLQNSFSETTVSLDQERSELQNHESRVKLLEDIPCGTSFPKCKFIRDAYVSRASIPNSRQNIQNLLSALEDVKLEIEKINPKKVELQIEKYEEIISRQNELTNNITRYSLEIEKNESLIQNISNFIEKLEDKLENNELNKEVIENLENLSTKLTSLNLQKKKAEARVSSIEQEIFGLYKAVGSYEEKLKSLLSQRNDYNDLREEYSAFDLYMRCMHPNGIAFDVIKKKLPIINEEIAKILANIVDFEVFFEDDGQRLDIFIKHPQYDPRPLEMGSGAEKTLSAMAIRLALLSVSSLPKSDIFILDEPGTSLDEENMQGFVDILSIIKSYFKTVLLISHLESLKDCVDMQITIDKKNGYASVNV